MASPASAQPSKKRVQLADGPVPLYYQLEQDLRNRIASKEFEPGSSLPTEDRICEQYGVSRITVRRALDALNSQRLIVRRRGVGSFVAETPRRINSKLTGSLSEFLMSAGALHTTCVSLEPAMPPAEVSKVFNLSKGQNAILLRAVGALDDGDPVAYLEIWFPLEIGEVLTPADLGGSEPIVRIVERKHQLRLVGAEQIVEPGRAGSAAGRHLQIAGDTPILRVKRVYYVHPHRPIEVAYVRYHPERYRYAIDFK
jgi:GntR family transcriptional regulator